MHPIFFICSPTAELRLTDAVSNTPFLLSYPRAARTVVYHVASHIVSHHLAPTSPHHPVLKRHWRRGEIGCEKSQLGVYEYICSYVKSTARASSACPGVFIYPRFLPCPDAPVMYIVSVLMRSGLV